MDTTSVWGKYAPPSNSWPWRLIIKIGLSRGGIRKKLIQSWQKQFGHLRDLIVEQAFKPIADLKGKLK